MSRQTSLLFIAVVDIYLLIDLEDVLELVLSNLLATKLMFVSPGDLNRKRIRFLRIILSKRNRKYEGLTNESSKSSFRINQTAL